MIHIQPPKFQLPKLKTHQFVLPAILLLAASLRLLLLRGQRFHPDEALYASWARLIATGGDVWLAERVVDKPPLFIYTLAALFGTVGASEEIARLPNLIASLCSIVLVFGIACELYRDRRVAALAASVLALSPLAILFTPTAFLDPLMVCWLLASAWLGLRGRVWLSGLAFGMSLATKQDAILFAPLLLGLQIADRSPHAGRSCRLPINIRNQESKIRNLKSFFCGAAPPLILIVLWSAMRPQPDFLQASLDHYGGLSLAAPDEYIARALSLVHLSETLSAGWLPLIALLASWPLIIRERNRFDVLLWASSAYWLAIHLVVSFPIWDRYMLPLAPLVALLIGRNLIYWLDHVRARALRLAVLLLMAVLLVQPARAALQDEIHVGRDFDRHAGVDQVGEFFWHIDTTATVVYMHDLSWELDYYTFGQPLDRRWSPGPEQLAADAAHMWWAQRFAVLAEWEPFRQEMFTALATKDLKAEPAFITRRRDGSAAVYVYKITPQNARGGYSQLDSPDSFTFD